MSDNISKKNEQQLPLANVINWVAVSAWSNGRMFDVEQYKNRRVDTDIKDVPDKALKFEEWFSRHYS